MNKSAKLIELLGAVVDFRMTVTPTRSFGDIGRDSSALDFDLLQRKQDIERKKKKDKKKKQKGIDPIGFRPGVR